MFKKIISSTFVIILIIFSTLTAISCTTTNLSEGYQNIYFKHAKIASFAAKTAILNDSNEAKGNNHMPIAQKYLINKYGEMKIDDALGKDFVINQGKKSTMNELFETTFGDSNYTYVKNKEPRQMTGVNEIISNDTSGYFAGTKSISGISKLVETLLDVLTVGLSPTSLATVLDLAGESIGGTIGSLFALVENNSTSILKVLDDYVLDYKPNEKSKAITIKDIKTEILKNKQTISNIVQYITFSLKVGYNYFDEYLKNKSLSIEEYSKNNWVNGIGDDKINLSKLSKLFKYMTTTDSKLITERKVATKVMVAPIVFDVLPTILGNLAEPLFKEASPKWKQNGAADLIKSVFYFVEKVAIYIDDKSNEEVLSGAVNIELKAVVKELLSFVNGTTSTSYKTIVKPVLEEIVKLLPGSIAGIIGGAIGSRIGLIIAMNGVVAAWGMTAGEITKAIKPALEPINIDFSSIFKTIFNTLSTVFNYQPIKELITDDKLLNQIGTDGNELNSTMAILSIFKYVSIENIAKFFEDKFEAGKDDITFNLQNIKELVLRVSNTKVKIKGSTDEISLSKFITGTEPIVLENIETIEVVYTHEDGKETSYEYNKSNLPTSNVRAYIALGLKSSRTSVHAGSVGETVIEIVGGETGPMLYSLSTAIQSILIEMPKQREEELDKKFFKPLYDNKLWTMDKLSDFKTNLPIFEEGKETKFDYNLYRKLPNGKNKTYVITLVLDENNYWSIAKITK